MSNLAQLQGGGQLASAVTTERKVNNRKSQPENTEKLLLEKDEEIRRMQAMIQQMQSQLGSGNLNSLDDSATTV